MSRLPGYRGSIFNRVGLISYLHYITSLCPFDPTGATDLPHVGNYLPIDSLIFKILVLNEARGQISLLYI
jgi:hypothetical protein